MSSFKPHFLCFLRNCFLSRPIDTQFWNRMNGPLWTASTAGYPSGTNPVGSIFGLVRWYQDHPCFPSFLGIRTDPNPDNRDFYPAHQIFRKLSRKMILKVAFWLVVPDSGTPESTSDILVIGPSENRFFQNERFPTLKK